MAGSTPSQQSSYRSQPAAPAPAQAQAAPQTSGGGGLFGNMASTAAGVAVGSTLGHGLSGMLFGGRGEAAPVEQQQTTEFAQEQASGNRMGGVNCEAASKGESKARRKRDDVPLNTRVRLLTICWTFLHLLRL